ncbi:phage tail tape measure protein [Gluconobacter kanchanaburiensis]|uniref:Phage tail lysozyme domain-containing protein n=1 Tax=Gluconobacter kanchanaburiensis NBRC 103587 TaxID=1307948 RepID=A0A511B8A5_9PROT|nr:hypothetical protein [Gluconobacter kanchanaburiensis]MBF0861280.1 hypothetical protein [Gluconobacter kanchanaburiensis]GBR71010.1 hypothetical protein AA103587_2171 [Gluconobacter kanchanaburiensis NBRC 103587]GEK95892.1 hypothetical protein GKA01_10890 [Gluconobacter kanchanaburiensis NBRC 103587]
MPNVIDSLVIQLGLDGRGVAKGAQQASKSLDQVERSASKTQSALADSGKAAADGFSRARTEALALLAVFTGGRTLKTFTSEITRSNAELGYMAQRLDMDPRKLYQMQRAVMAVGGSAQEVGASFQAMQGMLVDPAQAGNLQRIMGQLGVRNYTDQRGHIREDILKQLNRATQGMDQGVKNTLLSQLGIGQGEINLIDQTTAAFDKLQNQFRNAGPTSDQIRDSQQLLKDWVDLTTTTEGLGRAILGDLTPAIDGVVTKITAWEKENPDLAKHIGEITLGVVALGTALGAVGTAVTGVMAIRGIKALLMGGANIEALKSAACGCECGGGAGAGTKEGAAKRPGAASEAERMGGGKLSPYLAERTDAAGGSLTLGRAALLATRLTGWGAVGYAALHAEGLNKGESGAVDRLRARGAFGPDPFGAFARSVAGIESHGRYDIMGGAGGKYAGKYQMGAGAIQDAARRLHEAVPSQSQFLNDPAMQERFFKACTEQNAAVLSSKSEDFRNASLSRQYAILAYAHNQGAGGALNWMRTGQIGHDAFGTAGTRYSDAATAAIAAQGATGNTTHTTEVHVGDVHIHANTDNPQQLVRDFHEELRRTLPLINAQGQT